MQQDMCRGQCGRCKNGWGSIKAANLITQCYAISFHVQPVLGILRSFTCLLGPRTHRLTFIQEAWHRLFQLGLKTPRFLSGSATLRHSAIITRCSMSWSACSSTFCRDSGYFEGVQRCVRFWMVLQHTIEKKMKKKKVHQKPLLYMPGKSWQ